MAVEISGKVLKIGELQTISEKLSKVEVVIDTAANTDRRENPVCLEFPKTANRDNTELLRDVRVGDEIQCAVDIRGRRWQPRDGGDERYFVSLACWKLSKTQAQQFEDVSAPF